MKSNISIILSERKRKDVRDAAKADTLKDFRGFGFQYKSGISAHRRILNSFSKTRVAPSGNGIHNTNYHWIRSLMLIQFCQTVIPCQSQIVRRRKSCSISRFMKNLPPSRHGRYILHISASLASIMFIHSYFLIILSSSCCWLIRVSLLITIRCLDNMGTAFGSFMIIKPSLLKSDWSNFSIWNG